MNFPAYCLRTPGGRYVRATLAATRALCWDYAFAAVRFSGIEGVPWKDAVRIVRRQGFTVERCTVSTNKELGAR